MYSHCAVGLGSRDEIYLSIVLHLVCVCVCMCVCVCVCGYVSNNSVSVLHVSSNRDAQNKAF